MRHSIEQLHLSKQKQAQFESKGLTSVEDIAYFFPRRYIDFRKVSRVNDIQVGEFCALEGVVKEKWEGGGSSYTAKIEELQEAAQKAMEAEAAQVAEEQSMLHYAHLFQDSRDVL